jgi:hypothetical protein
MPHTYPDLYPSSKILEVLAKEREAKPKVGSSYLFN